jgi:hypothetical protein
VAQISPQISPQIRLVALAGLLLAVLGGGAVLLFGRSQPTATAPPAPSRLTTSTPVAPVPAAPPARAKPATHRAAAPVAAPARDVAKPGTASRGNLVDARLPAPLQWALSRHRIVVVSLYNPRAEVDAISVAEAHAGAKDAKVGYLLVNLLDDKVAGRLTGLLPGGGLLPNPGVLIFRAPGRIVFRFDGFVDRDAVAQAAASAADGRVDPSVTDPTVAAAAAPTGQ